MLLEAWKEFEVFHLSYAHVPPIAPLARARLNFPSLPLCFACQPRSFWYKFIQSTCKLFQVLGLRNEEYSPKMFSCSHESYTWSDRHFCAISLLEFVSERPVIPTQSYWIGVILVPLCKSNAVLMFQTEHGNDTSQERIKKKMPRRVKKRRKVQTDDGVGDIISFQFACLFAILVAH